MSIPGDDVAARWPKRKTGCEVSCPLGADSPSEGHRSASCRAGCAEDEVGSGAGIRRAIDVLTLHRHAGQSTVCGLPWQVRRLFDAAQREWCVDIDELTAPIGAAVVTQPDGYLAEAAVAPTRLTPEWTVSKRPDAGRG